jgi:myo-inositol-1(or 4)-monophosphatase
LPKDNCSDLQRNAKLATSAKSSPKDLVTFYDKAVEEHLLSKFSKSFPGELVIGEETCAQNSTVPQDIIQNLKSDSFWLLDPIDGTTNYARAYPFFCTTAAFCKKTTQGWDVLVGGVYNPVSQEMFSAARGCGAYLNRSELRVSQIQDPIHSLMITGFASERSQSSSLPFEIFQKITKETLGVRRDGSAALDLSFVAAGRVDAYWEFGLAPWDTAAGSLLVEESQGQFSDLSGDVSGFFRGEILATNGILHKWVINRIKEIRNESA